MFFQYFIYILSFDIYFLSAYYLSNDKFALVELGMHFEPFVGGIRSPQQQQKNSSVLRVDSHRTIYRLVSTIFSSLVVVGSHITTPFVDYPLGFELVVLPPRPLNEDNENNTYSGSSGSPTLRERGNHQVFWALPPWEKK